MRRSRGIGITIGIAVGVVTTSSVAPTTAAQDALPHAAYRHIEQTVGSVPHFFKEAWAEMKSVQLNLNTKPDVDPKTKGLIGLAVAAQVPCNCCLDFHTQAAWENGATDEEIKEAIVMAALSRHWSTILIGINLNFAAFNGDTDAAPDTAGEKEGAITGMGVK